MNVRETFVGFLIHKPSSDLHKLFRRKQIFVRPLLLVDRCSSFQKKHIYFGVSSSAMDAGTSHESDNHDIFAFCLDIYVHPKHFVAERSWVYFSIRLATFRPLWDLRFAVGESVDLHVFTSLCLADLRTFVDNTAACYEDSPGVYQRFSVRSPGICWNPIQASQHECSLCGPCLNPSFTRRRVVSPLEQRR